MVQHRGGPARAAGPAAPSRRRASRSARGSCASSSRWAHRAGNDRGARGSTSRTRCARSTRSGGPRRSSAPPALEKALDTPAHIYYKYEGVSPAGIHKPNTAVAQAYYNKQEGVTTHQPPRPAPASGALARLRLPACSASDCTVYMVKVSYHQKPYRTHHDATLGRHGLSPARANRRTSAARCWPRIRIPPAASASPSAKPSRTRSRTPDTKYSLGSVLNHVLPAPDRHRPGGDQADGDGRRVAGRRHRLRRRRLATSPASPSPSCATSSPARPDCASSPSSRPPARR